MATPNEYPLNSAFFGYEADNRVLYEALEQAAPYGALYRYPIVPSP